LGLGEASVRLLLRQDEFQGALDGKALGGHPAAHQQGCRGVGGLESGSLSIELVRKAAVGVLPLQDGQHQTFGQFGLQEPGGAKQREFR